MSALCVKQPWADVAPVLCETHSGSIQFGLTHLDTCFTKEDAGGGGRAWWGSGRLRWRKGPGGIEQKDQKEEVWQHLGQLSLNPPPVGQAWHPHACAGQGPRTTGTPPGAPCPCQRAQSARLYSSCASTSCSSSSAPAAASSPPSPPSPQNPAAAPAASPSSSSASGASHRVWDGSLRLISAGAAWVGSSE
jgi:hypothetical protein